MSVQSETGNPNYPPPPPNRDKTSNATKAALCGIIPGVGAVYNQDYMKAVVHLAAFSGLCIFAEASGVFSLLAFVFYVFTIFDAYRSAMDPTKTREFSSDQINMPLWGVVLIVLGVVFLLDSLDAISIRSITKFWPLGLVFLGCYMVFQYFITGKNKKIAPGTPGPMPGPREPVMPVSQEFSPAESTGAEILSSEANDPADLQDKDV
jgi:LiaI-LiaF-like transmembrane region